MFRFFRGVIAFAIGILIAALVFYLSPFILDARQFVLQFVRTVIGGK
jgi:hypothetical protein